MLHRITVMPENRQIEALHDANLLQILRQSGFFIDAPCGGAGKCGKCTVILDGKPVSACQITVDRDMNITLPDSGNMNILSSGTALQTEIDPIQPGYLLAFDIGTTTVAGYLMDEMGRELASHSALNPQTAFGADVITRIQKALSGQLSELTNTIRSCLSSITEILCQETGISPDSIGVISVVGNPAMQQLFLGICPDNLARIPFSPILTKAQILPAAPYFPLCQKASLLNVPDIAGFVGADTVACILSSGMADAQELTLLVDIGTNGEMVLGNRQRMVACSTAAGPALEGANIQFGMRGQTGAIDHVWLENGKLRCSVIGGGEAKGICGSGLIDAAAVAGSIGILNSHGNILNEPRIISLTEQIFLTQEDIRQLQLAKGAIAAGITLMAEHLHVRLEDISKVYLAGAFGSFMDPDSACRIGLLPPVLSGKIQSIGNAAGSGAKQIACSRAALYRAQQLTETIEFLELASVPGFQRCFAKHMRF